LRIGTRTVVVDELGDREFSADLVINNNAYSDDIPYPGVHNTLRGPQYCMLRDAFRDIVPNRGASNQILVTLGGSDLAGSFKKL
jgi:spore coat polysaccharide biosynthesis predicted glycosyltransferase SpsG